MASKGKNLSGRIEVVESESAISTASESLASQVIKTRTRRKSYTVDLRIQSPVALGYLGIEGIDTAPALVRLARVKGIDVIAVTDYNCGDYVDRIVAAAQDSDLTVIPGVVVRCALPECKDVVLSCLFPEGFTSRDIAGFLAGMGVPMSSDSKSKYVITRAFDEIVAAIDKVDGIAIPSRMDKTPYRKAAIKTLVEKYGFRAFDLAYYPESIKFFKSNWPRIKFELMTFSNATALAQVGSRCSKVKMAEPGFDGLRALAGRVMDGQAITS